MTIAATTYFQGSFRAPAAATIRFTYDPAGVPQTSDYVVAAGTTWDSTDAIVTAIQAQLTADFGAGLMTIEINDSAATTRGTLRISTDGPNLSVDWSQSGDGTDIRDWLGEAANIANQATPYNFTAAHLAGWYPQRGAELIRPASSRRWRAHMLRLDGTGQVQGMRATAEVDRVLMDCVVWFGAASEFRGHQGLETFVDDLFDGAAGGGLGEPFEAFHDGEQWTCRFTEERLRLVPQRVAGAASNAIWEVRLPLLAEAAPW